MEVLGRNEISQLLLKKILLTGKSWGDKHNSISPFTSRASCHFLSSRSIAGCKVIEVFFFFNRSQNLKLASKLASLKPERAQHGRVYTEMSHSVLQ